MAKFSKKSRVWNTVPVGSTLIFLITQGRLGIGRRKPPCQRKPSSVRSSVLRKHRLVTDRHMATGNTALAKRRTGWKLYADWRWITISAVDRVSWMNRYRNTELYRTLLDIIAFSLDCSLQKSLRNRLRLRRRRKTKIKKRRKSRTLQTTSRQPIRRKQQATKQRRERRRKKNRQRKRKNQRVTRLSSKEN